jgi:hypothetical protein
MNRGQFKPQDVRTRFMAKVRHVGKCWEWTGSIARDSRRKGHPTPQFFFDGKSMKASRAAWALFHGPIPDGINVCHTCDNPICVNPDHLFLGTQADNMRDCSLKGRIPSSKLNADKVRELWRLHATGLSWRKISKRLGVSERAVGMVLKGITWKHVTPALSAFDRGVNNG